MFKAHALQWNASVLSGVSLFSVGFCDHVGAPGQADAIEQTHGFGGGSAPVDAMKYCV